MTILFVKSAPYPALTHRPLPMNRTANSHDPKEFDAIFREYAPFVWRVLRRHSVPQREMDDLLQEVFIVIHRRLPDFEGRSSLRTWIYSIAVRVVHGYRRKAHVRREALDAEPPEALTGGSTPQDQAERRESMRLLEAGMTRLSGTKREAFALVDLEHLAVEEVADMLQCPIGTVRSRLHAARKELTSFVRRAHDAKPLRKPTMAGAGQ